MLLSYETTPELDAAIALVIKEREQESLPPATPESLLAEACQPFFTAIIEHYRTVEAAQQT